MSRGVQKTWIQGKPGLGACGQGEDRSCGRGYMQDGGVRACPGSEKSLPWLRAGWEEPFHCSYKGEEGRQSVLRN